MNPLGTPEPKCRDTTLAQLLKSRIRQEGPITFREFMHTALYDPEYGFYTKGPSIGTSQGTFNTNAMFPAFGYALAQAIVDAEAQAGEPLRVIEFGGGTGQLAQTILSHLTTRHEYIIVERSPGLRSQQESRGLRTCSCVTKLPSSASFIFGNEVLDAMPVHRIMGNGSEELLEMYIGVDEKGEFFEHFDRPSTQDLANRLLKEGIHLSRGQVGEINLSLDGFFEEISLVLSRGYVLFIDYGEEATWLYHHSRRNGTFRSFMSQRQTFDLYENLGEQDMTADVDFSAVASAADKAGLSFVGKISQGKWLQSLGIQTYIESSRDPLEAQKEVRLLSSASRLGSAFDVIAFKTPGLPDLPNFTL